jgi:hypothetical protein
MVMNRIQGPLRDLSASAIVEKHCSRLIVQGRELLAHPVDRKVGGRLRFGHWNEYLQAPPFPRADANLSSVSL